MVSLYRTGLGCAAQAKTVHDMPHRAAACARRSERSSEQTSRRLPRPIEKGKIGHTAPNPTHEEV